MEFVFTHGDVPLLCSDRVQLVEHLGFIMPLLPLVVLGNVTVYADVDGVDFRRIHEPGSENLHRKRLPHIDAVIVLIVDGQVSELMGLLRKPVLEIVPPGYPTLVGLVV